MELATPKDSWSGGSEWNLKTGDSKDRATQRLTPKCTVVTQQDQDQVVLYFIIDWLIETRIAFEITSIRTKISFGTHKKNQVPLAHQHSLSFHLNYEFPYYKGSIQRAGGG